jgi:hypothetical protein
LGVTRQRWAMRCARRTSRYHAQIDEGGSTFFRQLSKNGEATGAMRTAGDGDRLQRAKGSEPALKPERPKRKNGVAMDRLCDADGYGTREGGVRPNREDG